MWHVFILQNCQGVVVEWNKDPQLINYEHPDDVMIGILSGRADFHTIANYNFEIVLLYMEVKNSFFHVRCKMLNEPILCVIHELPMMKKWINM